MVDKFQKAGNYSKITHSPSVKFCDTKLESDLVKAFSKLFSPNYPPLLLQNSVHFNFVNKYLLIYLRYLSEFSNAIS